LLVAPQRSPTVKRDTSAKGKSLVTLPLARFGGTLMVDGTAIEVSDWAGSQNHLALRVDAESTPTQPQPRDNSDA
jgi:hypothetical protein